MKKRIIVSAPCWGYTPGDFSEDECHCLQYANADPNVVGYPPFHQGCTCYVVDSETRIEAVVRTARALAHVHLDRLRPGESSMDRREDEYGKLSQLIVAVRIYEEEGLDEREKENEKRRIAREEASPFGRMLKAHKEIDRLKRLLRKHGC